MNPRSANRDPLPHPISGLDLEVLRTFVTFTETTEVVATARTLGVSASVVSRRLQGLQPPPLLLVEKRGNTVVLTDKGQTLLPEIQRLLREYDQLAARLSNRDAATRTLQVAVGGGVAYTRLPAAVALFQQQHPEVRLRITSCRGRERIRGVIHGDYDLALVSHSEAQIRGLAGETADVLGAKLRDQTLVALAAKSSADGRILAALPAKKEVPASILVQLHLLGLEEKSGLRRQLDAEFRHAGVTPPNHYALYPGGWEALRAFAQHGLGTALLPAPLAEPADSTVIVRPVLAGYTLTDRVIWLAHADELTTAFVATLQAAYA